MTDLQVYLDAMRGNLGEESDGPPKEIFDVARAYTKALKSQNDSTKVSVFYWGKHKAWAAKTQWPRYAIFLYTDDGKWYVKDGVDGRKRPIKGDPIKAVEREV